MRGERALPPRPNWGARNLIRFGSFQIEKAEASVRKRRPTAVMKARYSLASGSGGRALAPLVAHRGTGPVASMGGRLAGAWTASAGSPYEPPLLRGGIVRT